MPVPTTRPSLLDRLGRDPSAWEQFEQRYGALIRGFAACIGMQPADRDDVLQNVLLALSKAMPGFKYDPGKGKFRSYLKTVTMREISRIRQKRRLQLVGECQGEAFRAPEANADDLKGAWEKQWRQYHVRRAMYTLESECNETTMRAFEFYVLDDVPPRQVAQILGISIDQVYQAKTRIGRRLRKLIEQQILEEG